MIRLGEPLLIFWIGSRGGCVGEEDVASRVEEATADSIAVFVDPVVELVSTIPRLAGVPPFNNRALQAYVADLEEHFGRFRDHRAIEVVRDLGQDQGINGSAPMALAVYLTWPDLRGKVPIPPLPEDLDPRWTPETVTRFRDAVLAFAADTRFMAFYADHEGYYARSVQGLRSGLEGHPIIPWLEDYFVQEPEHYVIIVGMQIGTGDYGRSTTLEDGSREFVSVMRAHSPSLFRRTPQFT